MDQQKSTAGAPRRPWEGAPQTALDLAETAQERDRTTSGQSIPAARGTQTARGREKPAAAETAPENTPQPAAPLPRYAAAPGQGVPAAGPAAAETAPQKQPGFAPLDAAMALVFCAVGWLFWEWQLWGWGASRLPLNGTALFTLLYAAAVLGYLFAAKRTPPRESWFWLAVLLGLGLAYALPYGGALLGALHYGALLLTATYWTLCAAGRLMKNGRTSNWLALDLFSASCLLPWGNFLRLPAALLAGAKRLLTRRPGGKKRDARRVWAALGGVAAAAVCLCAVVPSLMAADDGFARLMDTLGGALFGWDISPEIAVKLLFAAPTALFLYGLVYGAVRGRRTDLFDKREVCAAQAGLRFAPRATVLTALYALCAVYLLFLSIQAKYLFGAFFGVLPEGFTYSGYARQGFFELCRVAAINIAILILANVLSREQAGQNRPLRLCNIALPVLTLLLLATAAAKMAMYIAVYGLTVKRVLVSVFLVWMAVVFLAILLRQFRPVPLVRAAVFTGAALFTLLCVLPVERGIDAYNAAFAAQEPPAASDSLRTEHDTGNAG